MFNSNKNSNGEWVIGSKRLEVSSNFVIKLHGLRNGLILTQNTSLLPIVIGINIIFVVHF